MSELDTYFPSLPLKLVIEPIWSEELQIWCNPSTAQMADRARRLMLEQVVHWLYYGDSPETPHGCGALLRQWLEDAGEEAA